VADPVYGQIKGHSAGMRFCDGVQAAAEYGLTAAQFGKKNTDSGAYIAASEFIGLNTPELIIGNNHNSTIKTLKNSHLLTSIPIIGREGQQVIAIDSLTTPTKITITYHDTTKVEIPVTLNSAKTAVTFGQTITITPPTTPQQQTTEPTPEEESEEVNT
jgi:hypothetical protein